MQTRLVLILLMSLYFNQIKAQSSSLDSLLNNYEFKKAWRLIDDSVLDSTQINYQLFKYYTQKKVLDSAYYFYYKIDTLNLNAFEKANYFYNYGKLEAANNQEDQALLLFKKAQEKFELLDETELVNEITFELYASLNSQRSFEYPKEVYLNRFLAKALELQNYEQLGNGYLEKAVNVMNPHQPDSIAHYFSRADQYAELSGNKWLLSRLAATKGVYHSEITTELDSAEYYFNLENEILSTRTLNYRALYNYMNKANVARKRGDVEQAINYLLIADSIPHDLYRKNNKIFLYSLLAYDYETLGNIEEALKYTQLSVIYRDSVNVASQNTNLTKFKASERELDVLKESQKSARNKNIAYGLGGSLLLSSIIAFLVYRNTKRKQRIAEQEKEIEVQKTEKLLKDQELNTIDAMIAGQEKERQRLASDLHDSVGATLSAAKMQFEHLKKNRGKLQNEEEIYERTKDLLEEAYTEVRSMAHAKNSGVIAKNGLLPAVTKLAKNASATGKLSIEVQDYGLEQRLEGSLEIAVFRIIQELVTNIIKHADASEASISLTQHDDSINVVVEDNGRGFIPGNLTKGEGMGLGSIEKRVEHMEGQIEVDSTPGKGSSIIIDIPL